MRSTHPPPPGRLAHSITTKMSNTEKTETQNVSEEQILEQQFNYLLLELNQDTEDKNFNCQEECDTLTEEYIPSTSCESSLFY